MKKFHNRYTHTFQASNPAPTRADLPDKDPDEEFFEEEMAPLEVGSAYSLGPNGMPADSGRLQTAIQSAVSGILAPTPANDTIPAIQPRDIQEILADAPIKYYPEVRDYLKKIHALLPTLTKMDCLPILWSENLLLAINDDCGLSDILSALFEIYVAQGVASPNLYENACAELAIPYIDDEEQKYMGWDLILKNLATVQAYVRQGQASCTIVMLDISEWMNELNSPEIKDYLKQINALTTDCLVVYRIPFVERQLLLESHINLSDIMGIQALYVPPIGIPEMVDYICDSLSSWDFTFGEDCLPLLESYILQEKEDNSFFGFETLDKMSDLIILQAAEVNSQEQTLSMAITPDIIKRLLLPRNLQGSAWEQLERLVGADTAKDQIRGIVNDLRSGTSPALHMLFTGNAGTGKSKVARLLALILKEEGLLRKGQLYEIKGDNLCGDFPGQTAPQTSAICRDALGSVLFIDEISALFEEGEEDAPSYGREAMDALLAEMGLYPKELCVILAGTKEEIKKLLSAYPALDAKAPHRVELADFSREELETIFMGLLDESFDYDEDFKEAVHDYFSNLPEEYLRHKDFSNARFVRNLFENLWGKASYRAALHKEEKITLYKSDLENATASHMYALTEKKRERLIGF